MCLEEVKKQRSIPFLSTRSCVEIVKFLRAQCGIVGLKMGLKMQEFGIMQFSVRRFNFKLQTNIVLANSNHKLQVFQW